MQVVTYAALPKTKPPEYLATTLALYRFLRDHTPDFKEWKRFLREKDLWDQENFDALMTFFDVKAAKKKPVKMGAFLQSLAGKETFEDQQKMLFKHLAKRNEILVKYVLDGLAERLYSTNELYRYITSYVYPGEYITLLNFKAWMEWLQATGHIKMIGIRWGLSPMGEDAMSYIRTIDVEDILEEEEEGDEHEADDEEDEADDVDPMTSVGSPSDSAAPAQAAAEIAPVTSPEAAPSGAAKKDHADADDGNDGPIASYAQAMAERTQPAGDRQQVVYTGEPQAIVGAGTETVQVVVQPIRTEPDETPLRLVREAFAEADEEEELDPMGESTSALGERLEMLRVDEDSAGENLRALISWWLGGARGRVLRSTDYGFSKEVYDEDPAFALFRLSCLAVYLFRFEGRLNVGKGGEAFGMLDQMGFFTNAYKSRKSIDKTVAELFDGGLSNRPELFCNLHYVLLLRRAIKGMDAAAVAKLGEGSADEVAGQLWQTLGHFSLHYEIVWILRELHLLGAWENEALADLRIVPLPRARENAFRLGFIETPYVSDFPALVAASRRLSKLLGPAEGLEGPLMYFEPERYVRYGRSESAFFTRDQLGID